MTASFREPYRANEFVVKIGEQESPTVSRVSGLSFGETETIEVPEGGTNVVHKVSKGEVKFQSLTIERYVDGSEDDARFGDFFKKMFNRSGEDGTTDKGQGSLIRCDGAIVKKHFGQEVMEISFYGAWIKSMALSDLEAGSTNLLKQTVVLEHEGLEWVNLPETTSTFKYKYLGTASENAEPIAG
jgi:phage tail-like protein